MSKRVSVTELDFNFDSSFSTFLGNPFWKWYESHKDDVILQVKFLIFKIDIQVYELKGFFEKIFGPHV